MRRARERFPQLASCWVSSPRKWSFGKRLSADVLIAKAVDSNFTGLALDRRFQVNEQFVSRVKDARLKLYVWTVDDAKLARKLAALGVDGITTNRPLGPGKQSVEQGVPAM